LAVHMNAELGQRGVKRQKRRANEVHGDD
jgi:hypothetical protein